MEYVEKEEFLKEEQLTLIHRRSLGKLAAEMQNAMSDFSSQWHRRWKGRDEILGKPEDVTKKQSELDKRTDEIAKFLREIHGKYVVMFKGQYDFFMKTYSSIKEHFLDSHIHNDLHSGNVKFDEHGNIVGVIDIGMAQEDVRIVEFMNLIIGVSDGTYMKYNREKLVDTLTAYQAALDIPLNESEIRGIIEVLRSRFLEEYFVFMSEKRGWASRMLKTAEGRESFGKQMEEFKKFADDFTTEAQISQFVEEVLMQTELTKSLTRTRDSKKGVLQSVLKIVSGFLREAGQVFDVKAILASIAGVMPILFEAEDFRGMNTRLIRALLMSA